MLREGVFNNHVNCRGIGHAEHLDVECFGIILEQIAVVVLALFVGCGPIFCRDVERATLVLFLPAEVLSLLHHQLSGRHDDLKGEDRF